LSVWWKLCGVALLTGAATARAQDPVRPWLDWRTIATPGYRFHYLPEFEQWTRHIAARVESLDSAVTALVGHSAPKPVQVVVDDPFLTANGYAIPFLDRPVTVWWATPPDPRNDIGNFPVWSEMLAVHEITHLAHLTRPSRNPFRRGVLNSLLNLGPITTRSPRWLYEGYATLVEGRITGSGRPNNVWRPAILRQWAIEGRLPTYGQLNSWNDFNGGEFAYLGGSAFLEWLTRSEGDSTLVHVWRRLTARRTRSFESSFAGVFGESPSALYGRHVAELTRDAMAAKEQLERAGLVEGQLVQRLQWGTGDPALSPDGERVAVALRERDRPGRIVIWKTATEPEDTAEVRRHLDALTRDPLDVPDRRLYPRAKRAEKTLLASNGRSYQMPRWFADNRRVLVTRWTARGDGSSSPALYVWNTDNDDVRQITNPVGVLHGDPHPNGKEAVAMQCHWGHCDIAHVDLDRGVMLTLLEGNALTTYYRPRYSPDGSRILASIAQQGRWRVVVADNRGRVMRHVDPDDGANRYDAQWLNNDTVVVVSERGGIANLELIDVASGAARTLTRTTGAALGPDVDRRDGSVWFLAMHSRGLDVRRLPKGAAAADSVVAISADRFGFAGPQGQRPGTALSVGVVGSPRQYSGSQSQRWLPGGYASADGAGGFLTVFSGDVIGRLGATATGAYGESGTWQGGALRLTSRVWPMPIELGAFGVIHEPSFGRDAQPGVDSLDATGVHGLLAVVSERRGEGWHRRIRVGGVVGQVSPRLGPSYHRDYEFGEASLFLQQSTGARGLTERIQVHMGIGTARSHFQRSLAAVEITTVGRDAFPIELSVTGGRLSGTPHPLEYFMVGGGASPIADSAQLSQRYHMPMFPTGVAIGRELLAWRAAIPLGFWTSFYEGASIADNTRRYRNWNRAIGLERRFVFGPMPPALLPRFELRGGAGYTLDAPFRKKVRAFFEMRVEP
jgi:hypothetical protein